MCVRHARQPSGRTQISGDSGIDMEKLRVERHADPFIRVILNRYCIKFVKTFYEFMTFNNIQNNVSVNVIKIVQ